MRRVTALLLAILSINAVFAQSLTRQPPDVLLDTWRTISDFGPRHENSDGERQLFDLIEHRFAQHGISLQREALSTFADAHSFSYVAHAVLPAAQGQTNDEIIIAVPVNHRFGASDHQEGALSPAAALTLFERIVARELPVAVRFLFLGGEKEPAPGYPLGSRAFVDQFDSGRRALVLYLDLERPTDELVLDVGAPGIVGPSWALQMVADAFAAEAVRYRALPIRMQLHRGRFADDVPALRHYLEAGIPAIRVHSGGVVAGDDTDHAPTLHTTEQMLTAITRLVETAKAPLPEVWDRHFIAWQIGERLLVTGEREYIIAILLFATIALLYAATFRHRFKRYTLTFLRNGWAVPAITLVLFLALLLSTGVLVRLLELRAYADLWRHRPRLFLGIKLVLAVFLFSVTTLAGRKKLLTAPSRFYSAAAIVFTFIAIVVLAVVQVSFTVYFLWTFVWAFLFTVVPFRPAKFFCLLIAPATLILAAHQMTTGEEFAAVRLLLLSPIRGNLLLTVVVLPFLLMLIRLDFAVRHPRAGRRSFLLRIVATACAALILVLAPLAVALRPYGPGTREPVVVHETVDLVSFDHRIVLRTPTQRTDIAFALDDRSYLWRGNPITVGDIDPQEHRDVHVESRSSRFLERKRVRLTLSADAPVYSVEIALRSETPIILYDANLPVLLSPDGRSGRIIVGVTPPLPLEVDLTFSEDSEPTALWSVTLSALSGPFLLEVDDAEVTDVRRTIRFAQEL
ncbi:MAG: hypothetical protein EA403_08295 [Spirochaetaceae bacterium]|nr:MAG: hypothetical protein EA403_08295 [Spirochaetaceae bacterium]